MACRHGLQVDGTNHLVPVDYQNESGDKATMKNSTVSLQKVQEHMEDRNTLVNVCIIDGTGTTLRAQPPLLKYLDAC